ncbi:hypothetical protein FF38_00736 [Lucilia cuprina]|uniref:CIDE-N domain-containing protein n=1 Tax=Lucilia cuprina TaxID=7375 RepID=A0A0L0CPY5_LUCCU|nr:hypothetical protein FF38_00736 [Lucilia cuprina]
MDWGISCQVTQLKKSMSSDLYQANSIGISGTKVVLECDGTEICDDEICQYYLETSEVLMLLEDNEWSNKNVSSPELPKENKNGLVQDYFVMDNNNSNEVASVSYKNAIVHEN